MGFFSRLFEPKAFSRGYLPVSDIHKVFYHEYGNPQGAPVICFHGGPGYWSNAKTAKNFDLKKCRVILFDQRGCGKSVPAGEMKDNTTADLAGDAAKLLDYLKISGKVTVFGSSWGSTLALLFAERYPERVSQLIISKIFLANRDSRDWELKYSGWFYPDMLEKILEPVEKKQSVPEYYAGLINSGDLQKQVEAVNLYGSYEFVLGELSPSLGRAEIGADDVSFCRIFMNYSANKFFLEENQILDNLGKIKNIPAVIIHNRLDLVCPLVGAYELHKKLPRSKLVIVPDYGHGSEMMSEALKREIKGLF